MKSLSHYIRHFFVPHHSNNQRAKLLHHDTIFAIALLFFIATFVLSTVKANRPDVLGLSVDISSNQLLLLTNQERAKNNEPALANNNLLAAAADAKAVDMFTNNYWAHISPKGITPWFFIQKFGYVYSYAGENLARGFINAPDVIAAWMASPTHRANMLSTNYQDVGFAIRQGSLTGEKDTVLIVEMFGGKAVTPPLSKTSVKGDTTAVLPITTVLAEGKQQANSAVTTAPFIDRFSFAKNITQMLLVVFITIFILDFLLIERKKITRIVGHNLDHVLFLSAVLIFIMVMNAGAIF